MNASENKRILQEAFGALAEGNGRPFGELMADDFCWTVTGTTKWSRTYRGKLEVQSELIRPLFARFASRYTNTATRFIAEGDHVVVECRGHVTTNAGARYDNQYCYVIRMAEGRMKELTEYMDTALAVRVLGEPENS
jgi:ketosteroid isomerase-like protein